MKDLDLYEDETEYFGFIPYCFTMDLQQSLEEAMHEILEPDHDSNKTFYTEFRKNCFVMINFISRNILKFPENYKYERILTDKIVEEDVFEKFRYLVDLNEKHRQLKFQLDELDREYARLYNINQGYQKLFSHREDYKASIEKIDELKEYLEITESKYDKCAKSKSSSVLSKNKELSKLLEHKEIENEFYKVEYEKLNTISEIKTLDFILNSLNK